jgi:hypothetical protein
MSAVYPRAETYPRCGQRSLLVADPCCVSICPPTRSPKNIPGINVGCSRIIRREDGGVGLAVLSSPTLCFYDRRVDPHGVVTWPLRRTVQIDAMLGLLAVVLERGTFIAGYTEEADTILLKVNCGDQDYEMHMVHLHSMEHRKLQGEFMGNAYCPFASFYLGGKHFLLCLHLCGIFFRIAVGNSVPHRF